MLPLFAIDVSIEYSDGANFVRGEGGSIAVSIFTGCQSL